MRRGASSRKWANISKGVSQTPPPPSKKVTTFDKFVAKIKSSKEKFLARDVYRNVISVETGKQVKAEEGKNVFNELLRMNLVMISVKEGKGQYYKVNPRVHSNNDDALVYFASKGRILRQNWSEALGLEWIVDQNENEQEAEAHVQDKRLQIQNVLGATLQHLCMNPIVDIVCTSDEQKEAETKMNTLKIKECGDGNSSWIGPLIKIEGVKKAEKETGGRFSILDDELMKALRQKDQLWWITKVNTHLGHRFVGSGQPIAFYRRGGGV